MSAIIALLQRLDALDVKLSADAGKLRINAPKGALTPALTDALRTHKAELLSFLEQPEGQRGSIPRAPRDRELPLTLGQERLWFIDQVEGQSSAYNLSGAFRMRGPANPRALQQALATVIARHEILRTSFPAQGGRPVQQITPASEAAVPFAHHDLRGHDAPETAARGLVRAQALAPFDLAAGPLLRLVFVELAADHAIFLVAMHHIVSDGWSMGRFIEEVAASYQAALRGELPRFPELPIQVADFAVWQRQWAKDGQLAAQVDFWKRHLLGAPPLLDLPLDHRRPALQSYRGKTLHFAIDGALGERLRQLCQAQQCTPYMLLLAAFAVLLYRYSGQDDLPIASPIANRNRAETEALIGFFVNTLVTRVVVDPTRPFLELLAQVKQSSLDAYTNQDAPFSHVVDALQPERNPAYNPIFQVMFDLQNAPAAAVELSGLRLEPLVLDDGVEGTAMFDLSWTMQEQPAGFTGQVEYAVELFEQVTIERRIASFACLLEHVAADPTSPVLALGILPPAERRRVVELGCAPSTSAQDPAGCVHHAIAAQAQRAPGAPAVVWHSASLSYAELDARANQLAHHLRALGVARGGLVGICLERCLEMPIAVLGVLKTGAAYVPLDPSYPADRLAFMQADAGLRLVLTKAALAAAVPSDGVQVLTWEELEPRLAAHPSSAPDVEVCPEDAAYVIYTSGSTGQPKGVVVAHGPWLQTYRAWAREYRLETEARSHLQMAAFSFDVCCGDFVRALCSGGKLVLCPRDYLLSPPDLYELMVREAVECAEFVPAVLRELHRYLEERGLDLAFMRVLIAGSDVWYGDEYQRFRRLCGPHTRLINSYGVTEAVIDSTYFEAGTRALHPERHVPIGRPFPDTRLYVLDARGEPVPTGVAGELYLAGPRLAREYWRQPQLTAERFLPDPFSPEPAARMYRTGDAARFLYDGAIEVRRTSGPPGQDPRPPHRARRDRDRAGQAPAGPQRGGDRPRRAPGSQPAGRLCRRAARRRQRRRQRQRRRKRRRRGQRARYRPAPAVSRRAAPELHGAGVPGAARRAADDPQRQGRSQGLAGPQGRPGGRARADRAAGGPGGGDAGGDLAGPPCYPGAALQQLLRARRRLHPGDPGGQPRSRRRPPARSSPAVSASNRR
ncbi:MAG: amino acid adenylation domain-containing protein [Myxococcales bacterium]|nr:amino acid adenylation domain-containing protein [Myxococcales bacterium]